MILFHNNVLQIMLEISYFDVNLSGTPWTVFSGLAICWSATTNVGLAMFPHAC